MNSSCLIHVEEDIKNIAKNTEMFIQLMKPIVLCGRKCFELAKPLSQMTDSATLKTFINCTSCTNRERK